MVFLSPLILGSVATILSAVVTRTLFHADFLGGVWLPLLIFYSSIIIMLAYGVVLVENAARVFLRRRLTRGKLDLFSPLLFGAVVGLVVGLLPSPLQLLSDEEDFFTFYGFPFTWRWIPRANCPENAVLNYFSGMPPLKCLPGYSMSFLAYDVVMYVGLFLWMSYLAAPFNEKWPVFLPRVEELDEKTARQRLERLAASQAPKD